MAEWADVETGVVTNVVVAEADVAAERGWVGPITVLTPQPGIGWSTSDGGTTWTEPPQPTATPASTPVLPPITVTSGVAFQPTPANDCEIIFDVTHAGTLNMTQGITALGASHTVLTATVSVGTSITKRIEAGWSVKITTGATALISTVKVQQIPQGD